VFTRAISSGEVLKSGNPCERLIAPTSVAKADITVKIVVPVWGSLEIIGVMQGLNYG
jgi:hypothetical protein